MIIGDLLPRHLNAEASTPLEAVKRHFQDTVRTRTNGRPLSAPHAGDPHDLAADVEQWDASSLPPRDSRIDQNGFEPAFTGSPEWSKAVAGSSRAHAECKWHVIRIEDHSPSVVRHAVVAGAFDHTRVDAHANFTQPDGPGHRQMPRDE